MSRDSSGAFGGERASALAAGLSAFAVTADDLTSLLDEIALHAARNLSATVDVAVLGAGATLAAGHLVRGHSPEAPRRLVDTLLREQPMLRADLEAGRPRLMERPGLGEELPGYVGPLAFWPLRCASRVVGVLTALRPVGTAPLTENELLTGGPWAAAAALALGYALSLGDGRRRSPEPAPLDERSGALELGSAESSRGRLSHELRTPLNVIIGFSSLLHAGKVGDLSETQREYVGDILTSSKRLLELVNHVLEPARGADPRGAAEEPDGR